MWDHEAQQCFPECYRVTFYHGFIQSHAVLWQNSTLTTKVFGTWIFLLSLLSFSLITYFLCRRRHFMFVSAQVVFWPGTEWPAKGWKRARLSFQFTPTASVHPWQPSPLLYLPLSLPSLYLLHLLLRSLLSVFPLSVSFGLQLTYCCSSSAKPMEMTAIFITY